MGGVINLTLPSFLIIIGEGMRLYKDGSTVEVLTEQSKYFLKAGWSKEDTPVIEETKTPAKAKVATKAQTKAPVKEKVVAKKE